MKLYTYTPSSLILIEVSLLDHSQTKVFTWLPPHTYLIKISPHNTIKDPLTVGSIHHHEGMEFHQWNRVTEIEFPDIWEVRENSTGLVNLAVIEWVGL